VKFDQSPEDIRVRFPLLVGFLIKRKRLTGLILPIEYHGFGEGDPRPRRPGFFDLVEEREGFAETLDGVRPLGFPDEEQRPASAD